MKTNRRGNKIIVTGQAGSGKSYHVIRPIALNYVGKVILINGRNEKANLGLSDFKECDLEHVTENFDEQKIYINLENLFTTVSEEKRNLLKRVLDNHVNREGTLIIFEEYMNAIEPFNLPIFTEWTDTKSDMIVVTQQELQGVPEEWTTLFTAK